MLTVAWLLVVDIWVEHIRFYDVKKIAIAHNRPLVYETGQTRLARPVRADRKTDVTQITNVNKYGEQKNHLGSDLEKDGLQKLKAMMTFCPVCKVKESKATVSNLFKLLQQ